MDDQYRIPDSSSPAGDQTPEGTTAQANEHTTAESAPSPATGPIADAWTPVPESAGETSTADDQPAIFATPEPPGNPPREEPYGYAAATEPGAPSGDGSATSTSAVDATPAAPPVDEQAPATLETPYDAWSSTPISAETPDSAFSDQSATAQAPADNAPGAPAFPSYEIPATVASTPADGATENASDATARPETSAPDATPADAIIWHTPPAESAPTPTSEAAPMETTAQEPPAAPGDPWTAAAGDATGESAASVTDMPPAEGMTGEATVSAEAPAETMDAAAASPAPLAAPADVPADIAAPEAAPVDTPPAYTPPAETAAAYTPVADSGATNPPAHAPEPPAASEAAPVEAALSQTPPPVADTAPAYTPPPVVDAVPSYMPPPLPPSAPAASMPSYTPPQPPAPPAYTPPAAPPAYTPPATSTGATYPPEPQLPIYAQTNPPAAPIYAPLPPPPPAPGYAPPPMAPQPQSQWQTGPMGAAVPSAPSAPLPPTPGYAPYAPPPMDQGYYMQPMVVAAPQKDNSTVALVLEAVCGLFGLYGIGWLIGGYTTAGILLLAGGLLFGIFLWIAAAVGAVFTAGLTLACPAILNIAVLLTSTLILNSKLKQRRMGIAG